MVPERGIASLALVGGVALSLLAAVAVAGEVLGVDPSSVADDGTVLQQAVQRQRAVAKVFDRSHHFTRAAVLMARSDDGGAYSPAADAALAGVLIEALARAPSSPYNWARLAAVRWRQGRPAAAAEALEQSVRTGRHAPRLAAPRAALAYALVMAGQGELEQLAVEQVRHAAAADAPGLAAVADDALFAEWCRETLTDAPRLLRAFERAQARRAAGLA